MKAEMEGRVAVVTGGAQGIGRAICLTLAREGADLVIADMDMDGAKETAAMVKDRQVLTLHVDVSSEESVKQLYSDAMDKFSKIDVMVNNAGICRMIPIIDIEVAEWDKIMAVNLRGTFLMSREAFRLMIKQGGGRIINIASASAKIGGVAAGAHYSASKAGVVCFTKSLALQAAPYKINVNAVSPGPVETALTEAWGEEINTSFAAIIPWKEYGKPQDVAEAVAFLASDKARYITGEILDVNGGLVMD